MTTIMLRDIASGVAEFFHWVSAERRVGQPTSVQWGRGWECPRIRPAPPDSPKNLWLGQPFGWLGSMDRRNAARRAGPARRRLPEVNLRQNVLPAGSSWVTIGSTDDSLDQCPLIRGQRMIKLRTILLMFAATCCGVPSTEAQPGDSTQAPERAADSRKLADEEVKRFAFFLASDRAAELKLHSTPVHQYSQQQNGQAYTNLFVWTHQARPAAIASISNWYSPRAYRGLAVTSLATETLVGTRDDEEIWRPNRAGVEFKRIPDAGRPHESAVLRLRQMRGLAREFSAEFKRIARIPEGDKLRLLSTPLYRYENQETRLIDGALFGFAYGTAPQLILLIEARQTPTGPRWLYALAPKNSTEYRVRHKNREVWHLPQLAPPWPNSKDPTNTYSVFPDLQREGRTKEFVDRLRKFTRQKETPPADVRRAKKDAGE